MKVWAITPQNIKGIKNITMYFDSLFLPVLERTLYDYLGGG